MRTVLSLVIRAFLAFLGARFVLASLPTHAEKISVTPVPEPDTLGLPMLGLAGLALRSRT